MKFRINFLVPTCMSLMFWVSTAYGTETGTSNNLFYLKKLEGDRYFVSRSNLATRDGFSDLFFGYVDASYGIRLNEHWSVDAGYRHARLEFPNRWRDEYRPLVNLSYREQDDRWRTSNRHRLEFRYFDDDSDDRVRYRNETVITGRFQFSRFGLSPFVSQEIFYEFTDDKLNENWLTVGVVKSLSKRKKIKFGYRWQARKFAGNWSSRHLLVTGLSLFSF